jgi:hypothetical protein
VSDRGLCQIEDPESSMVLPILLKLPINVSKTELLMTFGGASLLGLRTPLPDLLYGKHLTFFEQIRINGGVPRGPLKCGDPKKRPNTLKSALLGSNAGWTVG